MKVYHKFTADLPQFILMALNICMYLLHTMCKIEPLYYKLYICGIDISLYMQIHSYYKMNNV